MISIMFFGLLVGYGYYRDNIVYRDNLKKYNENLSRYSFFHYHTALVVSIKHILFKCLFHAQTNGATDPSQPHYF